MDDDRLQTTESSEQPASESNTVALIGFILLLVSTAACGLLFFLAARLPDSVDQFAEIPADSPAKLALVIVGSTTAVLTLVALILSTVGLLLPNRPRTLALAGTIGGCVLLTGIFGVLAIGILMNPAPFGDQTLPNAANSSAVPISEGLPAEPTQ